MASLIDFMSEDPNWILPDAYHPTDVAFSRTSARSCLDLPQHGAHAIGRNDGVVSQSGGCGIE